jgi:hypothetical protein
MRYCNERLFIEAKFFKLKFGRLFVVPH